MNDRNSIKHVDTIYLERIVLRGISESDTDCIIRLRCNDEVYKYFKNPHRITKEEHENWLKNRYAIDKNRYDWIAVNKNSQRSIGVFGVTRANTKSKNIELNYLLDKEYRGFGFAHEAINGIINWAKSNWNSNLAIATIHKDNSDSISFVLREGFIKSESDGTFFVFRKKI